MKLPRDLSGREVVNALQRLGFVIVRQEGSHIRMSKPGARLTVPNHNPVHPKTLSCILRQAGISIEELVEQLR